MYKALLESSMLELKDFMLCFGKAYIVLLMYFMMIREAAYAKNSPSTNLKLN